MYFATHIAVLNCSNDGAGKCAEPSNMDTALVRARATIAYHMDRRCSGNVPHFSFSKDDICTEYNNMVAVTFLLSVEPEEK